MKLISCDASSSIIGYTIFDIATKKLISHGHLILDKEKSLLERALEFDNLLKTLKKQYPDLTDFCIEAAFTAMFGTTSNAATTATLLQINAMYQVVAHYNGLKVNTITVAESRKNTFPGLKLRTLAAQAKIKEKELCFKLATENYLKDIKLDTKVISKGPRKGMTVYEDYVADIVDSYIVGTGFLNR